jgi:hypothetical protein
MASINQRAKVGEPRLPSQAHRPVTGNTLQAATVENTHSTRDAPARIVTSSK